MSEPTTLRLVLAIFSALKLNIDHLDIKTAFLNGKIRERAVFLFASTLFQSTRWHGMAHQERPLRSTSEFESGSIWAKTFRTWMHKDYPQHVEAGNKRCVYVMRESEELAPINLDELRELKIEKNEKIIIMIMNPDDMLIAYSDNARDLTFEC